MTMCMVMGMESLMAKHRKTAFDIALLALRDRAATDPEAAKRAVRVDRVLERGRGALLERAHKHRVKREAAEAREARRARTRYTVETWSPGDRVTRYRFFHDAPPNQTYFGPDNGIRTVLGMGAAEAVARNLQISGNAWVR